MSIERAGQCVSPHLQCLRWCGFFSIKPDSPYSSRITHAVYQTFILSCTTVYLLQQCVYAYQERSNMDHLTRVMSLLLCHITSLVKQGVFYFDARRIDQLIISLDDHLFNQEQGYRLVARCAQVSKRLQRVYSGTAVLICTLWLAFPIANIVRGLPPEFPFWLPMNCEGIPLFTVALVYSYCVTSLVGMGDTTMDAFIATVLYQCVTQMQIIRINLGTLSTRAKKIKDASGDKYEEILMKLFLHCLAHYEKVMEITKQTQRIFGTAILVQFGIGGWILCMAAYRSVSLNMLSVEFASMMLFLGCILTEVFLFCYFGNMLTVESGRLPEALFDTWRVGQGARFGRALMIATERARRPLTVTAGRVVPLSLETFLKILKSSYSFYAVLRQTK